MATTPSAAITVLRRYLPQSEEFDLLAVLISHSKTVNDVQHTGCGESPRGSSHEVADIEGAAQDVVR